VAEPQQIPTFAVDASWPTLPNDWVLGQVASVTVDGRDHVWVLHRPRTVEEGEEANAAPPVLEFDADGAFINAWGGPTTDFDWPGNEHGIHADHQGHIWVGGNGGDPESDDMLLKLTNTGELLLQIGGRGVSGGNTDTDNLRRPAESFVYGQTNEVFVADGYGNRRVIVLDADTGAFKRMWGAFGNEPMDAPPDTSADDEQGPPQFATVHGIEVADDGLVYVADRNNSRLQVFTLDGTYSTQGFVNRDADSASTVAGVAFSPDPQQQFLYIADQGNSLVHILDRQTLEVLDSFGSNGEAPGAFQALHHIASDSQGNIYTAEAQRGRRAQKFTFTGMVPRD
jgi:DNA-binding beta-propeller fold protein YncE